MIRKLGQQEKNVRKLFGPARQVLGKVSYGAIVFVTSDLVLSLKTHTFIIVILFLLCRKDRVRKGDQKKIVSGK